MPNRYRLKGASLEEIRRKAEQQHGPAARIVSAERVISPGIAGLFAGDRYEAIVEVSPSHEVVSGEVVPDPDILAVPAFETDARPSAAVPSHRLQGSAIAALLQDADAAELDLHRPGRADVSTASPDFAELLEQLGAGLGTPIGSAPAGSTPAGVRADGAAGVAGVRADGAVARGPVAVERSPAVPARVRETAPVLLSGVGDLVVLVGLGEDALDAALAISQAAGGADVRTAGKLSAYGHLHVDGRQDATAARAHAVLTDQTVLVAFGLGKARDAVARLQAIAAVAADQIWVVVDAGRKHEDTARWVRVLTSQLNVTAVAAVGAADTATPETVSGLGLPVGWTDSNHALAGSN